MKAVIQKSGPASVTVDNEKIAEISNGLVILLGIKHDDTEDDVKRLADKIGNLRIFEDAEKYFQNSVKEINQEILLISQFTLYADCSKGRRPDFGNAAKSEKAEPLYNKFVDHLRSEGIKVSTGKFGANMKVALVNEGPITIILES